MIRLVFVLSLSCGRSEAGVHGVERGQGERGVLVVDGDGVLRQRRARVVRAAHRVRERGARHARARRRSAHAAHAHAHAHIAHTAYARYASHSRADLLLTNTPHYILSPFYIFSFF